MLSPLAWQMIVAVGSQLSQMSMGASLAFTSILLLQIQSKENNIQSDLSTLSWIASTHGTAAIGAVFMPSLMQRIGRKRASIISCVLLSCGWVFAYIASNAWMIIFSEAFLGFGCNCVVVVNSISLSEMLAPKYRTMALTVLGYSQSLGMVCVSFIGTFIHWKNLSLIMLCPVISALAISLFLPESPPWLAYKAKFKECESSFKLLRGTDLESLKEFNAMCSNYKLNLKQKHCSTSRTIFKTLKSRDFNIPCLYMTLILLNIYVSGAVSLYIYSSYTIQIATGDKDANTIGLYMFDGTIFLGVLIALILVKYTNNKTILNIACLRIIFLILCSIVLYLQKIGILSKNRMYFLICFEGQMLFTFCGLQSITFSLAIELIPVKYRGIGGALFTILTGSMHSISNKLLPYLMIWLDLWGTLLAFAVNGTICHYLIWKYVPETKNKTLVEIEDFYNKNKLKRDTDEFDLEVNIPIVEK